MITVITITANAILWSFIGATVLQLRTAAHDDKTHKVFSLLAAVQRTR